MKDGLISIVVPMYYEEAVAEACYERITAIAGSCGYEYELIFVNDGSRDRTQEILEAIVGRDSHVRVLSFSRNFGHQTAVSAGIDKSKGDAVIIIDADLQDPPELIPEMLRLWEQDNDVVYARRSRRKGESWFKLATAKAFYRLLRSLTDIDIPVDTGDFRLMDRKVVEAIRRMPERNRFLRGMVSWVGFKQVPVEYRREERYAGETKYPLKKMLKLAADGIISFSFKPAKLPLYLGFVSILISLVMVLAAILLFAFKGVPSSNLFYITALIVFFGGVQLVSIGILGQYIIRIYDESRKRPLYIIEKEINTDEND